MGGLVDAEIVLWQDFEYDHKTVNFQDLLRLLVREKVGVRVPREKSLPFNNTSPMFYTALEKITAPPVPAATVAKKQLAIDERFVIRTWTRPLPMDRRDPAFPHCGCCFASFMLQNEANWHARRAGQHQWV